MKTSYAKLLILVAAIILSQPQILTASSIFDHDPTGDTFDIALALGDDAMANPVTNPFFFFDPTDPTDNTVIFDTSAQQTQRLVNQVTPIVTQTFTQGAVPGRDTIEITITGDGELFPQNQVNPNTGRTLDWALIYIGYFGNPIDAGDFLIDQATIEFFSNGQSFFSGPINITHLIQDPWNGTLAMGLWPGPGRELDEVRFTITSVPTPAALPLALTLLAAIATLKVTRKRPNASRPAP